MHMSTLQTLALEKELEPILLEHTRERFSYVLTTLAIRGQAK